MPSVSFKLARVVATPGALEAFESADERPQSYLDRHAGGDWGELGDDDKMLNDLAVTHDERILSAYTLKDGTKIWIITEADRSSTTILLPEEY